MCFEKAESHASITSKVFSGDFKKPQERCQGVGSFLHFVGFRDSGYLAKYISMWGHYTKHTSMTKSSLAELRAGKMVVLRSYHVQWKRWILTVEYPGTSMQYLDIHLFLCNFRNVFFPSQAHTILCTLY